MDSRMAKKFAPLLISLLRNKNDDERNVMISNLSDPAFDFVCKCLNTVVHNPAALQLDGKKLAFVKKSLEKERKKITYLAKKGGIRKRKRTIIATQSGSGIGIALATVLPLLFSAVKSLIKKK